MRRSTVPLRLFTDAGDGAGGGDAGVADALPTGDPAGAPPAPGTPTPANVVPPAQPPAEPDRVDKLPQWAQKELADARADAAKARQTARDEAAAEATSKITGEIAKALGITPAEGEKLTAEQLQHKLTETETERNADRRELAVYRNAGHEVNAAKLLDSRRFLAALAQVSDPSDDKAVRAAVDAFVADNAEYKASTPGRAPGASGADHGRTGEAPKPKTPSSLEDALTGQQGQ